MIYIPFYFCACDLKKGTYLHDNISLTATVIDLPYHNR